MVMARREVDRRGGWGAACPSRFEEAGREVRLRRSRKRETEVTAVSNERAEGGSRLRAILRREDGQSVLEFALTLPVLLLVVTGITAFGVAFNNSIILTEATSIGARQLTVSRGQTLDPCQTFSGAVFAAAPLLKQSNMTFTISLNGTTYTGTTCAGSASSGAPSNMVLGTNVVVTVTYPLSLNVYGMRVVPTGSLLTAKMTELMQ